MEALGVVLAIGVGIAILLALAFFGFVIWFIFTTFMSVQRGQKEFHREWNNNVRRRTNRN